MDSRRRVTLERPREAPTRVEELIQPLIDALSANVAILNPDATICAVNAAWRSFAELNGCGSDDYCLGMNYLEVCRQAERTCPEAKLTAAALQSVISGKKASSALSYQLALPDGTHHFQLTISRMGLADREYIAVCHEDVTAPIRLEEQRRSHAMKLLEAQDQERRHIARELHDSTAQHLTAMTFLLQSMKTRRRSSEELAPLLGELGEMIREAQLEIRTVSYLLHPPLLAEIGLEKSLRRYIEGFSRRTGVGVDFHWTFESKVRLGALEVAILRVVQEALTNVYRHARAQSAVVQVEAQKDEVRVTIADTGVGIAVDKATEGVGIPSMRSRVAEFGGVLSIARDDQGTRVVATFPLDRPVAGASGTGLT